MSCWVNDPMKNTDYRPDIGQTASSECSNEALGTSSRLPPPIDETAETAHSYYLQAPADPGDDSMNGLGRFISAEPL
jgi:hypothetical protein